MVAGAKVSGFEDLQAAVAAATDHSLLWACPGVHAVDSPLVVHGREDLTIAGAGALLIAIEESRLLDLEDSKQLTVRGLRFTQLHGEEPTLTAEVGGDLTRAALDNGNTFIPRAAEARAPALAPAALPNLKAAFPEKRSWPIIVWKDGRYAALDIEVDPETDPCGDDDHRVACPDPIPFTGSLPAGVTANALTRLQTVTLAGPCTMTGGTPIILDTTGCDRSHVPAAIVLRLTILDNPTPRSRQHAHRRPDGDRPRLLCAILEGRGQRGMTASRLAPETQTVYSQTRGHSSEARAGGKERGRSP